MAKKKKRKTAAVPTIDKFFVKKDEPAKEEDVSIVVQLDTSADDSDTIISPFKEPEARSSPLTCKLAVKDDVTPKQTPQRRLFSLFESKSRSADTTTSPVVVDVESDDVKTPKSTRRSGRKTMVKNGKGKDLKTAKIGVKPVPCVTINDDPETVTINDPVVVTKSPIRRHPPPLLWTNKYKPNLSSDLIGQSNSVNKFKTWLQEFFENRRTLNSNNKLIRRNKLNSPATSRRTLNGFIVEGDFDSDDAGEDNSCFLIHSNVHGVGKTSLIHTIANETSSEVFEMNCSMKRSGKIVVSTLQEVTQSNRLGLVKKPFFGTSSSSSPNGQVLTGHASLMNLFKPKKLVSEEEERKKRVKEERKREKEEKERRKKLKQEQQLINCNQIIGSNDHDDVQTLEQNSSTLVRRKRKRLTIESDSENDADEKGSSSDCIKVVSKGEVAVSNKLSFNSNSFILFDDVDVIFEEEEDGFWKSVRNLIRESKVPVVLTATKFIDSIIDKLGDISVETVELDVPKVEDIEEHLRKICSDEGINQNNLNFKMLVKNFNCDVRRCINELQFSSGKFDKKFCIQTVDIDDDDDKTDIESDDEKDEPKVSKGSKIMDTSRCYKQLHEPLYEHLTTIDRLQNKYHLYPDPIRRIKYLVNQEVDQFVEVTSEQNFASEIVSFMDTLYRCIVSKDETEPQIGLVDHLDNLFFQDIEPSPLDTIVPELTRAVNGQNRVNVSKVSIALDYIPFLVPICKHEEVKLKELFENKRRTRRFLHYFDSISLHCSCKGKVLRLYDDFMTILCPQPAIVSKCIKAIDPSDEGLRGSSDDEDN